MYAIQTTNKFEKDTRRLIKRNYPILLLKETIKSLEETGELSLNYKTHKLIGNYDEHWECHIKNDWLLIWKKDEAAQIITLIRTGTHVDLFGK